MIFLTNITWVFLSFFFIYVFLVVVFLPAFYKRFRFRFFFKYKNEFLSILRLLVLLDTICVLGYFFKYYIVLLRGVLVSFSFSFFFSSSYVNILVYCSAPLKFFDFNLNFLSSLMKHEGLM